MTSSQTSELAIHVLCSRSANTYNWASRCKGYLGTSILLVMCVCCRPNISQGEILSPVVCFFIEDFENSLHRNIHDGIEIDQITLSLLLLADDVVLFSATPEGLQ
jgi:hypothetical protein